MMIKIVEQEDADQANIQAEDEGETDELAIFGPWVSENITLYFLHLQSQEWLIQFYFLVKYQ